MKYGFIYETTNLINGKKYLGSHKRTQDPEDSEDSWYLGSGKLLWQAIRKYGIENFSRKIILECDSQEELEQEETKIILKYNAANDPNYYNIMPSYFGGTSGGGNSPMYGKHHSEETKEKIGSKSGASRKGMKLSDTHKTSIANSLGKEENRKRQSELIKGRTKVNNGEIEKSIYPEEIDSYLAQGYILGRLPSTIEKVAKSNQGKSRPQTKSQKEALLQALNGSIAISKDGVTKKVKPEELESYISAGWMRGMSEEFKENRSNSVKGKIHIYLGEKQKFLTPEDAEPYLSNGWQRGFPLSQRKKMSESSKIREQKKREKNMKFIN